MSIPLPPTMSLNSTQTKMIPPYVPSIPPIPSNGTIPLIPTAPIAPIISSLPTSRRNYSIITIHRTYKAKTSC